MTNLVKTNKADAAKALLVLPFAGKHTNYDVKTTYVNNRRLTPSFNLWGNGMFNSYYHSIDIIDTLIELPKSVQDVFSWLKKQYDYRSNMCVIPTAEMTSTQRSKFYTGTKVLQEKNIIVRLSPGKYMINPMMLIPSEEEDRKLFVHIWLENGGYLEPAVINAFSVGQEEHNSGTAAEDSGEPLLHNYYKEQAVRGEWFTYSKDMETVSIPESIVLREEQENKLAPVGAAVYVNGGILIIPPNTTNKMLTQMIGNIAKSMKTSSKNPTEKQP